MAAPDAFPPGTLANIDSDRLPEACRSLRYSLPNALCAVLGHADDYDAEDYAYDYHGDSNGPGATAQAEYAAVDGPWVRVFVGGNADIPVFAVPAAALEEAES